MTEFAHPHENRPMYRRPILILGIAALFASLAAFGSGSATGATFLIQEGADAAKPKAEAEAAPPAATAHDEAAAPHDAHGEHAEGTPNPLKPEPTLTLWTLLVFFGLLFILSKFAWKPLVEALHKREEHLEHCLLQTEKARNDSEEMLAQHRRLMAQADEQVRSLIEKAQKDAQTSADQIVKQAQSEAEASKERAQRDISTARDQALAEIWKKSAEAAVTVAGRVLSKELGQDEHRRLLDVAIHELPAALPSSESHGGVGA